MDKRKEDIVEIKVIIEDDRDPKKDRVKTMKYKVTQIKDQPESYIFEQIEGEKNE